VVNSQSTEIEIGEEDPCFLIFFGWTHALFWTKILFKVTSFVS